MLRATPVSRLSDLCFETRAEAYPAWSARQRYAGVPENTVKKNVSPSSTDQGERLQRLLLVSGELKRGLESDVRDGRWITIEIHEITKDLEEELVG